MKRTKKPPLVHFTHHLCRVADPVAVNTLDRTERDAWCKRMIERREAFGVLHECWHTGSTNACHDGRRYTTDPSAVTCPSCVRGLADRWNRSIDHEESVKVAWRVCCFERGVPSPLTEEDTRRIHLEQRASASCSHKMAGERERKASRKVRSRWAMVATRTWRWSRARRRRLRARARRHLTLERANACGTIG